MVVSAPVYQPLEGHFDEMVDPDGAVRPHWRSLTESLNGFGRHELARYVQAARRAVRENGMTYHVQRHGEAGEDRPWPLDVIPCILSQEDWRVIESGVAQRARLLNALLADVYGPRRTVTEGVLPAELLFSHPGFLRPCHGMRPPGDAWLTVYAADIARAPDGRWRVIGDRTEAPIGAGYALENRLVTNETLGEALDRDKVRRLAPYFLELKQALAAAVPGRETPRVVVLTPGPSAETYFEHAYLAKYLGYTLVEGPDLVVRDNRVYLRTLSGLLPVDVILRRQASADCDPLELPSSATKGPAGLLDAVRAGSAAVANPLGSGFAQSPALAAFLPRLARQLLGEDLALPSAETWWCGRPDGLEHTLAHLDRLVVKPVWRNMRKHRVFARKVSEQERGELAQKLRTSPGDYVGQQEIMLSTTPIRSGQGLAPRHLVIRVFAVAAAGGYQVMPGGMARVTGTTTTPNTSLLEGGLSKDLWVLGDGASVDGEERAVTLLPARRRPVDVSRATFDLPSRMGENLYWLGRYAERVEATARLARALLPLLAEESSKRTATSVAGAQALVARVSSQPIGDDDLHGQIRRLVLESDDHSGFGWQVRRLRNTAWLLRDRLSDDAWRTLSRLETEFERGREAAATGPRLEDLLDSVLFNLGAFSGSVMEAMTRGHGWRLLDIGRRIERAQQIAELLRSGLVEPDADERARLDLILEAADSSITYRSRYLTSLQPDLVIDLLLIDDANPRAVVFQLRQLSEHVKRLPAFRSTAMPSPERRLVADALRDVEDAKLDALSGVDGAARRSLEELLSRIQDRLNRLSDALTEDYLTHAKPSRHLANR